MVSPGRGIVAYRNMKYGKGIVRCGMVMSCAVQSCKGAVQYCGVG